MWLTRASSCWHGRPLLGAPFPASHLVLGSRAQPASLPPVHLPGPFLGLLRTSVCHSASDWVSLCLSSPLSPRPQGVPLSEPAVPPRCPSLPPAQESAAVAAAPRSAWGSPRLPPGSARAERTLSCSDSPASLLPRVPGFPAAPQASGSAPRTPAAHLLSEPPGWPFLCPSHESITALPSRSRRPAD